MDTKKYEDQMPVDEGLQGNETIEEAILALQQEPTEEILAHTLTAVSYTHLTLPTNREV